MTIYFQITYSIFLPKHTNQCIAMYTLILQYDLKINGLYKNSFLTESKQNCPIPIY